MSKTVMEMMSFLTTEEDFESYLMVYLRGDKFVMTDQDYEFFGEGPTFETALEDYYDQVLERYPDIEEE
jgi:hypothetical protein